MEKRTAAIRMDHPVIITFLVLAIIAFLYVAAPFVKPLALAVLLSFALGPVAAFLERRGVPRAPAVVLTVVIGLGVLFGLGVVVWNQLGALSENAQEYSQRIEAKLGGLTERSSESTLDRLSKIGEKVTQQLGDASAEPPAGSGEYVQKVEIIRHPTINERVSEAVGPFAEIGGTGAFVLILVLFMLMNREDLRDRLVQMFGKQHISLTTRTMDEVGGRISRYLTMLSIVNASFGLVVGLGLWIIGIDYAVLWGFLAGALRFIPYVGPMLAFVLPTLFSIASEKGWTPPLEVIALFATLEIAANVAIEPVVYGKTTGISALGLLVAALFWTWLWGPLGLLLSTPLTVCLAVLGKSIPALAAFGTLLGEEADLPPEVRYYQRVLANDVDGAADSVEELTRTAGPAQLFDGVLLPALALAERDAATELIDEVQRSRLWRVTWDLVEELDVAPAPAPPARAENAPLKVIGVAAGDSADALALRMLDRLMAGTGIELHLIESDGTPLTLSEKIVASEPDLVLISHVFPAGVAQTRYLVRRLSAALSGLPIHVGLWGDEEEAHAAAAKLAETGAQKVVHTLAAAREALLAAARPRETTITVGPGAVKAGS